MCVCLRACMRAYVHACVRKCVCACVRVCACKHEHEHRVPPDGATQIFLCVIPCGGLMVRMRKDGGLLLIDCLVTCDALNQDK